ncbi:MAG: TetR/AcrR family transcriptional regulator [Brevibacterium sp.]|uniref:TetR/AcrR family transcriptional regulator n=1 Tax=Brevibacterium sp. TaxID=1701 RepID=UPI0026479F01|nr:TetR/AcrR family transcriptional regulator [Brevibacterium sp.]MDN5807482.1 TetR/AcrR family transcriptional regulator [Brevibacterium sp.]MDN5833908.1 TetR/AcrR family transcriptional regulator [Brevibacterium sp.]MDN5876534.1 TetR/AcrR family transcriptional regulator [Brevibacterium sp.]MDN5909621.1 TetR/AcrR family transcriptional regulator [Brevibacterium sp.]MDN6122408.1 TetR/AcrR family transcriptional regulator [Brevibacterium sp.]
MNSSGGGMRRLGRDALVSESMTVLAEKPGASMIDIASAIGVGRTTLYRHFGDREALIAEVARQGARKFTAALMDARPHLGPGLDAVERACAQLFTVPDVLTLMFADKPIITDDTFAEVEREHAGSPPEEGDPVEAMIRRGQADGSIAGDVPVVWAAMYVFLTIGSGHLFDVTTRSGPGGAESRGAALELTIRAIRKTLSAPEDHLGGGGCSSAMT